MTVSDKDIAWLQQVSSQWAIHQPMETGLIPLADHLGVTTRTVQNWLQRLQAARWIRWHARQGRGYKPKITLLKDPDTELFRRSLHYLHTGRSDKALAIVPDGDKGKLLQQLFETGHATDESENGSTLYIPFYRPIHDLHPQTATRRTEAHLIDHLHRGLLFFDRYTKRRQPGVAHHWETTSTGYRFYLRKNAVFHDGSPVTARDVQHAFNRLKRLRHAHHRYAQNIQRMSSPSTHVLEIDLHAPSAMFLDLLTLSCFAIIKPVSGVSEPLGCGPFKLAEKTRERTRLQAFDQFYGERPHLDQVEFWTLSDTDPIFDVNAHMRSNFRARQQAWPCQTQRHVEVGASWLAFNQRHLPALTNINVRSGLLALLDFSTAPKDDGEPFYRACGFRPGHQSGPTQFTEQRAAPLPAELSVVTYQMSANIRLAQWVVDCWQQAGLTVTLTILDYPDFARPNTLAAYDVIVSGEVFDEQLTLSYFQFFSTNNIFESCLPEILLSDIQASLDQIRHEDNALPILLNIEQGLLDQFAIATLAHTETDIQVSESVQDLRINGWGWMDFTHAWLKPA